VTSVCWQARLLNQHAGLCYGPVDPSHVIPQGQACKPLQWMSQCMFGSHPRSCESTWALLGKFQVDGCGMGCLMDPVCIRSESWHVLVRQSYSTSVHLWATCKSSWAQPRALADEQHHGSRNFGPVSQSAVCVAACTSLYMWWWCICNVLVLALFSSNVSESHTTRPAFTLPSQDTQEVRRAPAHALCAYMRITTQAFYVSPTGGDIEPLEYLTERETICRMRSEHIAAPDGGTAPLVAFQLLRQHEGLAA